MKILVDSTLSFKEDWFKSIPLIFNLDNQEIIDRNEEINRIKILNAKETSSSFMNFEYLKEKENLSDNEKTIIFTIPRQLSGQYGNYQKANQNQNILIVEGQCFVVFKEKIKKLLSTTNDLNKIANEINALNEKTKYYGLIINPSEISKQGRISNLLLKTFEKFNLKILLKFDHGKWKRKGFLRNVTKVVKKITNNKKILKIIAVDKNEFCKYQEIFSKFFNKEKIIFEPMTNSMVLHSGKGFICLYTK